MKHIEKKIPLHSLIILIGSTHSGKTTFAKEHFLDYEIVNGDKIREDLCGDVKRHDINKEVFEEMRRRVRTKLSIGERVIADNSNLKRWERTKIAQIGVEIGVPVFYIIIERDLEDKLKTVADEDLWFAEKQHEIFENNEKDILFGDGLAEVIDFRKEKIITVQKFPGGNLYEEIKSRGYGGITIIPDIHGTLESLKNAVMWAQMRGKFMIFLGDIIDYGPKPLECIDVVYDLVVRGQALMILGNHENKITKWLNENSRGDIKIRISEGNQVTIDSLNKLDNNNRKKFLNRYRSLVALSRYHIMVNNFMFSHAAIDETFWDQTDKLLLVGKSRIRALFGQSDPIKPFRDDGWPNKIYDWVEDIPKGKVVVVGHDIRSTERPIQFDNEHGGKAVFLDTGSGKGGRLSTADIKFGKTDKALKIMNFNWH